MSIPKYAKLNREEYINSRYSRYLKKKQFLNSIDPERRMFTLTDLDQNHGFSKPMKYIVICDRCNENIEDAEFVMLEDSMVYHVSCIENDHWFKKEIPVMTYNNVIQLFKK